MPLMYKFVVDMLTLKGSCHMYLAVCLVLDGRLHNMLYSPNLTIILVLWPCGSDYFRPVCCAMYTPLCHVLIKDSKSSSC